MGRCKKQKALNYDGEDIISNLPDVILSHMLSFLPTKEAARTSLLSKRWGYLWTCITRLEFHDESQYKHDAPETEKQKFLELVNRVLQQQISTSSIDSFTLCFSYPEIQYPSEDLNALIHRVLEQNVQKLSIKETDKVSKIGIKRVSVFPCAIYNSRSLMELDISVPTSLRFPSPNCLTNLQVLRFRNIDFFGDCFLSPKELMLSFPVLKVFEIVYCSFFGVNYLIIDTPMLESFVTRNTLFRKRLEKKRSSVSGTIKLFALGLRKFHYYGFLRADIVLSNPSTVVDVFLDVIDSFEEEERTCAKARRLLKEFHESAKFLELGPHMIPTLIELEDDLLLWMPIFRSLVCLVLTGPQEEYLLSDFLLKLLQMSSNLQRLEVCSANFGTTLPSSKDVPSCIQCNLKVVKIAAREWDEDKFQFTKYVLENARVLDQLIISLKASSFARVGKVIKELVSIPKASSSARIKGERITFKKSVELNFKYNYLLF